MANILGGSRHPVEEMSYSAAGILNSIFVLPNAGNLLQSEEVTGVLRGGTMSIADDLAKLADLKRSGDLTEEQYRRATAAVLAEHAEVDADEPDEPDEPEPFEVAPPPKEPKKKRKFLGLGWVGWSVVAVAVFVFTSVANMETSAERLEKLRVSDPVAYAEAVAKEEAAATAKAEAQRVAAEAQRVAQASKEAEEAAKKRNGFHCLSSWDGSHRGLARWTKENLNDPGSFEHAETRIVPVDEQGNHRLIMEYRAKNGFGGVVRGAIVAKIRSSDCELVEVISST